MIAYLEGTILSTTETGIILQVGSVGYELLSSKLQTHKIGESISVYTALHVGGDNQPILLAFESQDAKSIYTQLLKVPGVGPKTSLRIVESAPIESLKTAIVEGDYSFFTRVKGLGKKNAQKIILELKNTLITNPTLASQNNSLYEALRSLKFSNQEIDQAVKNLDLTGLSEQESLRLVLQSLGN